MPDPTVRFEPQRLARRVTIPDRSSPLWNGRFPWQEERPVIISRWINIAPTHPPQPLRVTRCILPPFSHPSQLCRDQALASSAEGGVLGTRPLDVELLGLRASRCTPANKRSNVSHTTPPLVDHAPTSHNAPHVSTSDARGSVTAAWECLPGLSS